MYNMLTIHKIKTDFLYKGSLKGDSGLYYNSFVFEGYGNFCDVYFKSRNKYINQEQVDKYNDFKTDFKKYLPEIELYILSSLKRSEISIKEEINKSKLTFDVIEIPLNVFKYDFVLVCGKTYKKFFFITRSIDIRVEFKNGIIKSIQRKKDTTQDN